MIAAVLTFATALRLGIPEVRLAPSHSNAGATVAAVAETISTNDNRRPAGTPQGQTLALRLETRTGWWFPESATGRGLEVAAFAEEGKPLQNPGPLIRVRVGTEVRVSLHNRLTRRLFISGFGDRRGPSDSIAVDADSVREMRFTATTPGVYYYYGRSTPGPLGTRLSEDSQLSGAILVDSASSSPNYGDRVFLMSWWFKLDSTSSTGLGRATMAINGLSWPHTERLEMMQGDSARWHVINLTEAEHPMHLHGFYFRTEAKGDGERDTIYAPEERRMGVTEVINPYQTMTLAWAATRPGNWIYHCHFAAHLSPLVSLDMESGKMDGSALPHHMSDRPHQMYGLVLGIRVAPHGEVARYSGTPRAIRLLVRETPHIYGDHPGYAFVLGGTKDAADPTALPAPGPTLVLQKGERVAVTIVNQTTDRAAVHWHGIELESYADGVPDWSGAQKDLLPSVAPGDSITVRFTPPRAGTFMYHSHFNEMQQISSGLYGTIIVLEPGQKFDPSVDRVFFISSAGPRDNVITGPQPAWMLNGQVTPSPIALRAGTKYRFRFIDLTADMGTVVTLLDGEKPVQWRALAKDGAMLPASQATLRPATLFFDPGEIYDFEYTARAAGNLTLQFGPPDGPPELNLPKPVKVAMQVR